MTASTRTAEVPTGTPEPTPPTDPTVAPQTPVAATPTRDLVIIPTATISVESQERMQRWLADEFPDVTWTAVAEPEPRVLDPSRRIEKVTDSPCEPGAMYIAMGGGFICGGDYLVVTDAQGQRIEVRTKEALSAEFAPVTSLDEAAGFAAIVNWSLKVRGAAQSGPDFLVWGIEPNSFGCGPHLPTVVVMQVSEDGTVAQLAAEPQPESDPRTPILCVD